MKTKYLFGAAAALMMAACSQDELVSVKQDGIAYSVTASKQTRAADSYCNNALPESFKVWARTTDGNLYIKGRSKSMILSANGQNIYPEEVEAVVNNQPYVQESVVVDRASKLVALVYLDQEALRKDGLDQEAIADLPERIRVNSDRQLPNYSQIAKVEIVDQPFEKTLKMSIKRFLYK